jgi:hypothetical protein
MNDKLAALYGGTGLSRAVRRGALAGDGWRARVATGGPILLATFQPWATSDRSMPSKPTCVMPYSVTSPVEGAETVVNLVGISRRCANF